MIAVAAEHLELRWEAVVAHPSPQVSATSSQVVLLPVCSAVTVHMVECEESNKRGVAPDTLATRFTATIMTEHEHFQSVVDGFGLCTGFSHVVKLLNE
jgi:hypothetical protein